MIWNNCIAMFNAKLPHDYMTSMWQIGDKCVTIMCQLDDKYMVNRRQIEDK